MKKNCWKKNTKEPYTQSDGVACVILLWYLGWISAFVAKSTQCNEHCAHSAQYFNIRNRLTRISRNISRKRLAIIITYSKVVLPCILRNGVLSEKKNSHDWLSFIISNWNTKWNLCNLFYQKHGNSPTVRKDFPFPMLKKVFKKNLIN